MRLNPEGIPVLEVGTRWGQEGVDSGKGRNDTLSTLSSRRIHGRLSAHLLLSAARIHLCPAFLCRFTTSRTVFLLIPRSRAIQR